MVLIETLHLSCPGHIVARIVCPRSLALDKRQDDETCGCPEHPTQCAGAGRLLKKRWMTGEVAQACVWFADGTVKCEDCAGDGDCLASMR